MTTMHRHLSNKEIRENLPICLTDIFLRAYANMLCEIEPSSYEVAPGVKTYGNAPKQIFDAAAAEDQPERQAALRMVGAHAIAIYGRQASEAVQQHIAQSAAP